MNKKVIFSFLSELMLIIGAIFIGSGLNVIAISYLGTFITGAVLILLAIIAKSNL